MTPIEIGNTIYNLDYLYRAEKTLDDSKERTILLLYFADEKDPVLVRGDAVSSTWLKIRGARTNQP